MTLDKKTNLWVTHHLITPEQAQAILAFEKSRHSSTFWRVAFSIAGLLIGLGIILLLASNWQDIPSLVKLIGAFTLQGALSYMAWWNGQKKQEGWKEFFSILSFLMIGATIGLIGQIFNLDGGWSAFALGWAILGLPFVYASRMLVFVMVWLLLLLSYFDLNPLMETLFDTLQNSILSTLLFFLISFLTNKLHQIIHRHTLLAKAIEKLMIWSTYLALFYLAGRWGLSGQWSSARTGQVWLANTFFFGFAAFRLFLAIRSQNIISFKRNALMTEIYIFLLFVCGVHDLFASGIGFIIGGLLILLLIYILRRTTQYIKQMEIFK